MFVSIAEEMNPSRRSTMEDNHCVYPAGTWGCDDPTLSYAAIYDGHGG